MATHQNFNEQLDRERIAKTAKGVLGYFVYRRRLALLVVAIIVLAGLFSAFSLPREASPEVKVPVALVSTIWPGASPGDVEKLVTDKLEKELENLKDLKLLTSSSGNSISSISVEFEAAADLDDSFRRVRDAVNRVSGLPAEAADPQVLEVRLDDMAVVTFSIVGDLTDWQLKQLGELVQNELTTITGVSRVELIGARRREIEIKLDQAAINRLNLTLNEVTSAVRQANLDLPLGSLDTAGFSYNLRALGVIENPDELRHIVVRNTPAGAVLLGDLAEIRDQLTEQRSISRIALAGQPARNTVSLQVYKSAGGNILEVVDEAKQLITELESLKVIPSDVDLVVTNDTAEYIREDFGILGRSGIQTMILIFVVLAIALSVRFAVIAFLSIPLIFLLSLSVLSLQGATLNSLTLFSLVLSLGLLIDTTIILLEGIYEGLRRGFGARESALFSISIYKWPIVAGVLTTVAAFVPMLLVGGITGQFLRTLPITISAVLISSLLVGLVIMPPFTAYIMRGASERPAPKQNLFQRRVIAPLLGRYQKIIRQLLQVKKARQQVYAALTILFIVSFVLVGTGVIKTELFPQVDIDLIQVSIELPKGKVLAETDAVTREVESVIADMPGLENYVANIGRAGLFSFFFEAGSASSNLANLTINLIDSKQRDLKSYELAEIWRPRLEAITGAKIKIEEIQGGPPTGAAIELQVLGSDQSQLSQAATLIKTELSQIQGVINIDSTDKAAPPEFAFKLDHEKLGRFNLTAVQVATAIRGALFGVEATQIILDDEDVEVVVRYNDSSLSSLEEVKNLEVTSLTGQRIKFSQVADFSLEAALETIQHRDTQRVVNITADSDGRNVAEINRDLTKRLAGVSLPAGISLGQSGEFEEEVQAFTDLYKAMSVAVLLIFFIMVLQFDSYRQPFVILLTLPLAFIGVIFGALLFGMPLGFATFLGIVALAGIVVNDAIVLVDRINDNIRNRKMEFQAAIAEAGEARLNPIILTTVTTVLGVTPLAFADEFWRGLSIAIIFGMIFATTLTLFVVPMLYQHFEKKRWTKYQDEHLHLQ